MSCPASEFSLWPRHRKQPSLNLNPGPEVGPCLFPAPVLFLLRDSLEIVHPDNGAAVGIVHCFSFFLFFFFQALLCFYDWPVEHERWCELQPVESKTGVCLWWEWGDVGSFISPWWGVFLLSLALAQALRTVSWSGSSAMMIDT